MKLSQVVDLLHCTVFTPEIFNGDIEIDYAFASDLMSDALMMLKESPIEFYDRSVLITGLVTKQCVRTAEMLDYKVVLICRDKKPNETVIQTAIEENIILIGTYHSMFSTNGRLFVNGIKSITDFR